MKEVVKLFPGNEANIVEVVIKFLKNMDLLNNIWFTGLMKLFYPENSPILYDCQLLRLSTEKDGTSKCKYRTVIISPHQVFEKIMFDQLYIYMNNFLDQILCRFCSS